MWYEDRKDKVILLKPKEASDTDVFKVWGSGNDWQIYDPNGVLYANHCDASGNQWIVVKVTTLNSEGDGEGESLIFYLDDINAYYNGRFLPCGVFKRGEVLEY